METPNARGIIIFANEDDIRWDRWHVQSPCSSEAVLEDPASSSHISQPRTSSFPSFSPPLTFLPPHTFSAATSLPGAPRNEPGLVWVKMLQT